MSYSSPTTGEHIVVPAAHERPVRFPIARPLRLPAFRYFMLAMTFFTAAMQIQTIGQGWLVFHLTGSSLALGFVTSMWSVALLVFSPIGGVIADRVDRRRVLMVTWGLMGAVFCIVTFLMLSNHLEVWHLAAASAVNGVLFAMNIPARSALISQLVPDAALASAMALTSLTFNLNGIIFPLIGGGMIDWIGATGAYFLMTLFYFMAVAGICFMPAQPLAVRNNRTSAFQDFIEGTRVVRRHRGLLWLMMVALLAIIVSQPYQVLLPAFAAETLRVPASGLGLLLALVGVGAFFGNLIIANLNERADLVRWMLVLGIISGISLVSLAMVTSLIPTLIVLLLLGATGMPFFTLNITLVQRMAPEEARGRVLSIYMLTWGAMPIGSMVASMLSDSVGMALPLAIGGVGMIAITVVAAFLRPTETRVEVIPFQASKAMKPPRNQAA
ncbi:MAG: MFS transporter [Chloroflexi bacterium]|nr:MFS transporter [Chloroflexota bacterium]